MPYQLVIFDFDGTLADTLPWMRSVFNDLADQHGFRKVEANDHERFRELHGSALLRALGLPLWKLPRVSHSLLRRMAERIDSFSLFPGISAVLRQLSQQGFHLALVSSNTRANVERVLGPENSALIAHFGCGASLFGKAVKLRSVVRASAVPARQSIYIGDEVRDAEAAYKAGLAFGAVAWGQHRLETLQALNPALIFQRVEDLAAVLA